MYYKDKDDKHFYRVTNNMVLHVRYGKWLGTLCAIINDIDKAVIEDKINLMQVEQVTKEEFEQVLAQAMQHLGLDQFI